MKYKNAIFTGRMEPPHVGHIAGIRKGLELADRVVVMLGSAKTARSIKNPWTVEERIGMIRRCFPDGVNFDRLDFTSVRDSLYNDSLWLTNFYRGVEKIISDDPSKVVMLGHVKDSSSYYLKMFPQWDFYDTIPTEPILNATDIRSAYFESRPQDWEQHLEPGVVQYLHSFKNSPEYKDLKAEYDFIKNYKNLWASAPYAPTFVTVDMVVVCNGHVLLVTRKGFPGRGLWALPGGFLDQNETIKQAAVRELKEETRIDVSKTQLDSLISDYFIADHPTRSLRGRTISHVFLADLTKLNLPIGKLPKVKGGDDAENAFWFPIFDVANNTEHFFEDHCDVILKMVNKF